MRILFPCLPYSPGEIEPMFEPQREAAENLSLDCSYLSYEDLQQEERLILRPRPEEGEQLLLRGWMFRPAEYEQLEARLEARGLSLLVSTREYAACHWLSGWYDCIREFTAETSFDPQIIQDWGQAFVKDQVKSCAVGGSPIVRDQAELEQLRARMIEFRGEIEGNLCFRRVENYTEEHRVFVWRGQAHGLHLPAEAQELARQVSQRINSPFYTIDLGLRQDGVWRVIELGDGQVSDLKEWAPAQLFELLAAAPENSLQ
ncbi:MAG: ATP-grasp domain-containing protein [Vulcanimicrobiota bacterium]